MIIKYAVRVNNKTTEWDCELRERERGKERKNVEARN